MTEIERDRALAAVMAGEEQAVAVLIDLRGVAGVLAGRRFDLDDVRAMIAQDHRRMRPGNKVSDLQDVNSVERTLGFGGGGHCVIPVGAIIL